RRRVELHGDRVLLVRLARAPAADARAVRAAQLLAERLVELDLEQRDEGADVEARLRLVSTGAGELDQRVGLGLDALAYDLVHDAGRRLAADILGLFGAMDGRQRGEVLVDQGLERRRVDVA